METSFFLKIYKKRRNHRIIVLSFWLICVLALAGLGLYKYYENVYNPAVVETADEYNDAAAKGKFINITTDKIYDLDLAMEETSSSSTSDKETSSNPKEYIEAVKLKDKILIVSIPIDKFNSSFANKKGPFLLKGTASSFEDKDYETLKDSIKSSDDSITDEKLDSLIIPKYLEYSSTSENSIAFIVFAAMLLVFVLIVAIPIMIRSPKALKRLEDYSNGNLQTAFDEIDNEIILKDVYKVSPIIITKSYIIVDTISIAMAMPTKELMWAYKKITSHKVNGIPTGKTVNLMLVFSDGNVYAVKIDYRKQNLDQILIAIRNLCSKTMVGFSDDLGRLFQKNRKEFINQWNRSVNG